METQQSLPMQWIMREAIRKDFMAERTTSQLEKNKMIENSTSSRTCTIIKE